MVPPHKQERRKHQRVEKNFVVSYRIYGEPNDIDISQSRNIGAGGMMLTTNRVFEGGTILSIEIRLPFMPEPIRLLGKVLESKEIARHLIYETRLSFTYMDDQSETFVKNTISYFFEKGS